MKKNILYFFFLSLVFLLITCKKDIYPSSTSVEGTLTDYWTGAPVDNADVYIVQQLPTNPTVPPYHNWIQDTITHLKTDGNGYFHYKFLEDEIKNNASGNGAGCIYRKDPWYNETYSSEGIPKGKICVLNDKLKGNALVQVHIKNQTPFNSSDYIKIDGEYDFINAYGGINHYSAGSFQKFGMSIDTTVTFSAEAYSYQNFYIRLYWSVTKNSTTQNFIDSVYCHLLTTQNYNLNY